MKLLVLGIGNMLLTDDGVGVFAARALMEEAWPEGVDVREGGTFTWFMPAARPARCIA